MTAELRQRGPHDSNTRQRAASGRPGGAGHPTFGEVALKLLENGYEPLPIRPGRKVPAPTRWSTVPIDPVRVETWMARFADCGVGLRTGPLVGLDIDLLDPEEAHRVHHLAVRRLGDTLMRVGLWPKRLLLFRASEPFRKLKAGNVEFLGLGQQFVAFGRHPDTGQDYYWPDGETPLDAPVESLPLVDADAAAAFLAEAVPGSEGAGRQSRSRAGRQGGGADQPVRNEDGLVVDGRDGWLSRIAFHEVHDALDRGDTADPDPVTDRVWEKFRASTDLSRGVGGGPRGYDANDAHAKVRDKLRLAREGSLPARDRTPPVPNNEPPTLSADEGRERLDGMLDRFCRDILAWHAGEALDIPTLGIRATVGLGKSVLSRTRILDLAQQLKARSLPRRVLLFTPSHALAEEAAAAWCACGADAAVARGYERSDPATGEPMCRDIEAVHAALASKLKVHGAVCAKKGETHCQHFHGCLKQANLRAVAAGDVVIAPYDALFTGLAREKDDIALLLIDEGCWARAMQLQAKLSLEEFRTEPVSGMGDDTVGRGPVGAMNDLYLFRQAAVRAFERNGPGGLRREVLLDTGLTAADCRDAARLERWRLQDPRLRPGLEDTQRTRAMQVCAENARIEMFAALWQAMTSLLDTDEDVAGNLVISKAGDGESQGIELRGLRGLHESLRGKPVLHLDATLRPELVRFILAEMAVETIDVSAQHMMVRHIGGSFGKSMICPGAGLTVEESARRENRLRECLDYVRWHARRVFPARVLVVTYKAVEAAFAGIPNVDVAHFNAIAGLDMYKDVAVLICLGRPLPSHLDLELRVGAYFGKLPSGCYEQGRAGILMRSGTVRSLPVIRHRDDQGESLRAAICDDELIQVIGRGRGVNRTADCPLEVHVMADVALPLVYDRLTHWDVERPDIVQRMLLDGVAVESAADAAQLHPQLFGSPNQAKLAFDRAGFKGQNPIRSSYREMTLKSASYKRTRRGRSWQRAWWIDGDADDVRRFLERQLGALAGWRASSA